MKFKHFLPALLFVAVLASQSACGSSESAVDKAARQSSSGALASSGPLEKYEKRASDLVFVTQATELSKIGLDPSIIKDASCLADELDARDHDGTADAFTCSFKAINGAVGEERDWEVNGPVATQLYEGYASTPTVTDSTPVNAYEATEQFRPFLYQMILGYRPGKESQYSCEGPDSRNPKVFYCSTTFGIEIHADEDPFPLSKIRKVVFADDGSVESFSEVSEIPANLSSPSADATTTTTTQAAPDLVDGMACGSRKTALEGSTAEIKLDVTGAISCEQGWQAIEAALAVGSETAPLGSTDEFKCDPPTSNEYGTTLGTCTARDGLARLTLYDITGLREHGYYD